VGGEWATKLCYLSAFCFIKEEVTSINYRLSTQPQAQERIDEKFPISAWSFCSTLLSLLPNGKQHNISGGEATNNNNCFLLQFLNGSVVGDVGDAGWCWLSVTTSGCSFFCIISHFCDDTHDMAAN